jgi:aryl-alcohol dehydrogenase-like predicted oxidoreductase
MRRRILGRTGLQVSELSMGTVELGLDYGIAAAGERLRPEEKEAAALLHFALDSGINLIDTARAYGESERIIGRALKGRRREYVLVSKVKAGRPEEVRGRVEESLTELQTDSVDVMMIHSGAEKIQPDSDTLVELQRQRESGKFRFLGVSVYGADAALSAIECGWFDCLEIAYSVLDRRPETGVLEAARRNNIGIIARSVLLKGALTSRYQFLPPELASLKSAIERLAQNASSVHALPSLAYRYVLSHEPPHSALVGSASRAELSACLAYAAQGPLEPDQIQAVQAVQLEDERWLNPGNWPAHGGQQK